MKDFAQLVKDYLKKEKKSESGQGTRKKESKTFSISQEEQEKEFKCDIDHTDFTVWISFKEEPDSRYWEDGFALHGTKCHRCKQSFLSKQCLPNIEKPAYTCVNQCKGCTVAYCHKCFQNGMLSSSGGSKSRRASRRK